MTGPDGIWPAPPQDPQARAFWSYSLALYGQPGVAAACLALQDEAGADVNLVLLCCWLGTRQGVRLSIEDLRCLDAGVAAWRDTVVGPLRAVRRTVKPWTDGQQGGDTVGPETRAAYQALKAAELVVEQAEQAALIRLCSGRGAPAPAGDDAVRANIQAYSTLIHSMAGTDMQTALETLIAAAPVALRD